MGDKMTEAEFENNTNFDNTPKSNDDEEKLFLFDEGYFDITYNKE